MSTSAFRPNELDELIWGFYEGTLEPAQAERLQELVLANPADCAQFVRWSRMVTDLEWMLTDGDLDKTTTQPGRGTIRPLNLAEHPLEAQADNQAENATPALSFIGKAFGPDGVQIGLPLFLLALVVAIASAAGLTAHLMNDAHARRVANNQAAASVSPPVAFLTSANGCDWTSASQPFRTVGSAAQVGDEIALNEGIAEFRMANGVVLGIEGPAALLLASPSKTGLQYGRLTAYVPPGEGDFNVVIAGCRVAARDAEFAVSLKQAELEIHVFSGEVAAASSIGLRGVVDEADDEAVTKNETYFTEAMICAGRSLRLRTQGEMLKVVAWSTAKPDLFVSKLSMIGPLPIKDDYVARVKAAKPVGYWRFEQIVDSQVSNEIEGGEPLVATDKSALVGNDQNRSAELRWNGEWRLRTKKRLPLKGTNHTIEAWIKPSHQHCGCIASLETKRGPNVGARLELQGGLSDSYSHEHTGKLRYVHRALDGNPKHSTSCFSTSAYAVRRWQHVVVVKTDSKISLYIDAKLAGSRDVDPELVLSSNPYLYVGMFSTIPSRRFIGQLDELAVYDRALTEQEVSEHFQAVSAASEESWPHEQRSKPKPPNDI